MHLTEKTIRALEDISNGTGERARCAAAILGFFESDGSLGMTYDGDPNDPRSVAYDTARELGQLLEEK